MSEEVEEDCEDLLRLVSQRRVRPSYTRAISREMSRPADHKDKLASRRHLSATSLSGQCTVSLQAEQSQEDIFGVGSSSSSEQTESSDDSVYDSCAEDLEQLSLMQADRSSDKAASIDQGQCGVSVAAVTKELPRRMTKRQKRKKRSELREFLHPFSHHNEFELIDSLLDDHAANFTVNKSVPSLVSMCLNVYKRRRRHQSGGVDGSGHDMVTKVAKCELGSQAYVDSVQFAWLHKFLQFCESSTDYIDQCLRPLGCCSFTAELSEKLDYCVRNLPLTEGTTYYSIYHFQVISALACTIDMMMPVSLSERLIRCFHKEANEDIAIEKASKTAEIRVQRALQKKYPKVVSAMFEVAAAYTWWARGNVRIAAARFLDVVKRESDAQVKSSYMNEMGRMYNYFGNRHQASRCFMQAGEFIKAKVHTVPGDLSTVADMQSLTLIANSHDQGILKTAASVSAWAAVLNFHEPRPYAFHAAYDSWLCFHAAESDGAGAWVEVERRLQVLVRDHPQLYHHLALCQAMQGSFEASRQSIGNFFIHADVHVYFRSYQTSKRTRSLNIWQPIISQVKSQGRCIKPMKMLWRTQLSHPVYSADRYGRVADHCSDNLRLWMTSDGLLTGSMQMWLPHFRGIYIDPYTGSLHLPRIPCPSVPCQKRMEYGDGNKEADTLLPTSIRLAENEQCRLDLMISCFRGRQKSGLWKYLCHHAQLTWTDIQGHSVKVNLKKIIADKSALLVEKQIHYQYSHQDTQENIKHYGDKAWLREAIAVHQKFKRSNLRTTYKQICNRVDYIFNERKLKEAKHEKKNAKKKKVTRCFKGDPPPPKLQLESYRVFGALVALVFSTGFCHEDQEGDTLVVVNWQDKQKVKDPKIYFAVVDYNPKQMTLFKTDHWWPKMDDKICHSDVQLWGIQRHCRGRSNTTFLSLFDEEGHMIPSEDTAHLSFKECGHIFTHIFNKRILGISKDERSIVYTDDHLQVMKTEPVCGDIKINAMDVIEGVVLVTVDCRFYVYDVSTMKPSPIHIVNYSGPTSTETKLVDYLKIASYYMKILCVKDACRSLIGQQTDVTRAVIGLIDRFMVVEITNVEGSRHFSVVSHLDLATTGRPNDAYFISEQVGFLVSCTFHNENTCKYYREHIYHYDYHGNILGVLPFLGPGPRSFFSTYLSGKEVSDTRGRDEQEMMHAHEAGWRVFLNDGYGGLACVKVD